VNAASTADGKVKALGNRGEELENGERKLHSALRVVLALLRTPNDDLVAVPHRLDLPDLADEIRRLVQRCEDRINQVDQLVREQPRRHLGEALKMHTPA